jgi:outer membrane murein-binding lipoprotein Lpp
MVLRRTISIMLSLLIPFSLSGCVSDSKYNEVTMRLAESNNKVTQLQNEINDVKYGTDKLLKDAQVYAQNKDINNLKQTLETLSHKHPSAPEIEKVKQLVTEVETTIKQEADAKNAVAKKEQEEKAKRLQEATSKMRSSKDEINNITWFNSNDTPRYPKSNIYAYFGKKGDEPPFLRVVLEYDGSNWVFVEKFIIKVDENIHSYTPDYNVVKRDNSGGKVWELYDFSGDLLAQVMLMEIVKSKKTIIRFEGKDKYVDYTLSDKEKNAIKQVLDAFEASGGKLSIKN